MGRLNVLCFIGFILRLYLSQIDCSLVLVAEVLSLRSTTWGEQNGNIDIVSNIILAFSFRMSLLGIRSCKCSVPALEFRTQFMLCTDLTHGKSALVFVNLCWEDESS